MDNFRITKSLLLNGAQLRTNPEKRQVKKAPGEKSSLWLLP
jgi:hypothetical protein